MLLSRRALDSINCSKSHNLTSMTLFGKMFTFLFYIQVELLWTFTFPSRTKETMTRLIYSAVIYHWTLKIKPSIEVHASCRRVQKVHWRVQRVHWQEGAEADPDFIGRNLHCLVFGSLTRASFDSVVEFLVFVVDRCRCYFRVLFSF